MLFNGKNQMVQKYSYLAKLKLSQILIFLNHIWHTLFGPIGLEFFMRAPETIIYRFWFFGPRLPGKWVWSPRPPLMVSGLQTQPKSWVEYYLEIMFSEFSGVTTPLLPPPSIKNLMKFLPSSLETYLSLTNFSLILCPFFADYLCHDSQPLVNGY